jgi:predicted O-methyltransferase YrrM
VTTALPSIEVRRVGEYGHFVAPLSQLVADLKDFAGVDLAQYIGEVRPISRDQQGVHPEEAAVLYLLTRALRPGFVLETGTFKGFSTAEIAKALSLNQRGHLITVDLDLNTGSSVPADLLPYITFHRGRPSEHFAQELQGAQRFDLFFHDSLHTFMNSLGELIGFADHYSPGALILCHDAKMDYLDDFGVGKAVRKFAAQLDLPFRILDTTCGLAAIKWPQAISKAALAALREEYRLLQRRTAEGRFKRTLRRLIST